ncbi:CHAT domain-containing protein [Krasilnikovia sp. MM14-A1259]|uniref:CHAT domain-containing protein n=1 Tax=Krasilnikovia sp. MM14-A1259 TaxID=3373539 RepID=UPI00381468D6
MLASKPDRVRHHIAAGDRFRAAEEFGQARAEYTRAISIIESAQSRWSSPLSRLRWARHAADVLSVLGEIDLASGRPDLACEAFEEALRRYSEVSYHESEEVSVVLNNLGIAYGELGRFEESDRALRRAMEIDRRIGRDPAALAAAWNNLSQSMQASGYLDEAARAFERATAVGGLAPGMIRQLDGQRSFHLMTRGQFSAALVRLTGQFRRAPEDSVEAAYLAGNLAQAYAEMQNPQEAQRWHRRAVEIRRKRQPGSLPLALALHNMADSLAATGETEEAGRLLDEAAGLAEAIAPRSAALASMRAAQAWGLLGAGQPAAAVALGEQALVAAPAAGRQLTGVRMALAFAYRELDQPDLARAMLEEAREVCEKISPLLPELRWVYTELGRLLLDEGAALIKQRFPTLTPAQVSRHAADQAASCFDRAIEVAETMRPGSAGEPGLELLFGTAQSAYHGRIQAAWKSQTPESAAIAFRAAESFRARTLAEILSGAEQVRPPGSEAATLLAELNEVRQQLGALYRCIAADPDQRWQADRDRLEEKAELLRVDLRALDPLAADRECPLPCTVTEVQRHLDSAVTVAVYEVTDDGVYLFAVRRNDYTFTKLPVDTATIVAAVEEVVSACTAEDSAPPADALRRLGEWLLRPIAAHLGNLAVCAGGVLAGLPFEALELDGTVVAELSALRMIPSATILTHFGTDPRHRRADRPFAGFATPSTPSQVGLPATSREVREAAAIMGGQLPAGEVNAATEPVTRVGAEVTVTVVRELASNARYVHFAMHGLISDTRPLYSGFPLSGGEFLHAYEIASFDLCADLVVCSACDTAKGESRAGEGTVGLAYALFGAGARAVLLSRWPITDPIVVRQMRALYRELADGVPAEQAVREAALEVRRQRHPHPREWASFVLISLGTEWSPE